MNVPKFTINFIQTFPQLLYFPKRIMTEFGQFIPILPEFERPIFCSKSNIICLKSNGHALREIPDFNVRAHARAGSVISRFTGLG